MNDNTTLPTKTENDFITLLSLSEEIGMDRSHLRRYVIRNEIELLRVRTSDSKGQSVLAVTTDDADIIRDLRSSQGFIYGENDSGVVSQISDFGYFYLILLAPELSANRVKIGFANNIKERVAAHKTTCPTLTVLKSWPCRRRWEGTAIDCAALVCQQIGVEVFDCDNTDDLIARIDAFFALLIL